MKSFRVISIVGLLALLASQTGCSIALQDAVASGLFDFVSSGITQVLSSTLLPG